MGYERSYHSPTGNRGRITNTCVLNLFRCHICGQRTRFGKTNLYRTR